MLTKLILTFLSCTFIFSGFPNINFSPNVFTPKNLTAEIKDNKVYIYFNAHNPENFFLGYNIYYSNVSESSIINAHRNLVKNQKINEEIENANIIPNQYNEYPSISIYDMIKKFKIDSRKAVVWIKHEIQFAPYQLTINYPFYVAVAAFSNYRNSQSQLSEIILVNP